MPLDLDALALETLGPTWTLEVTAVLAMDHVVDHRVLTLILEEGLLREDQVVLEDVELLLGDNRHGITLVISGKAWS